MRNSKLVVLVALAGLLLTPGCALVNSLVEYPTPTPRPQLALRPTFTPTATSLPVALPATNTPEPATASGPEPQVEAAQPPQPVETPTATPEPATPAPTEEPATPTPLPPPPTPTATPVPKPEAVVINPRVNVRSGPGTDFPVLGQVLQGERWEIVGRDQSGEWWQFCCFDGQSAWLAGEVVRAEGPLEAVALAADLPTPTAATTTTAEAAAATAAPGDGANRFAPAEQTTYPFNQDYLRVGAKVQDGADNPLAGYYLRVFNESTGQQWLSAPSSSGPWRGTAPSPDFVDFRQANLFFDTRAKSALAGNSFALWLVDGAGRPASPVVRYTQDADQFQWLYVVWTQQ